MDTPKNLRSPSDSATKGIAFDWSGATDGFANINNQGNALSYFTGLDGYESIPATLMAGDRNLVLDGNKVAGRVELKSGMAVAWDQSIHRFQGSVTMGDGSVQQLSSARLKEVLANTGADTNVVLIP